VIKDCRTKNYEGIFNVREREETTLKKAMTEAEVAVRQRFISIGCNRTPNAADCSKVSGRIAFGAHNTIALWDVTVPDSLFLLC